MKSQIGLKPNQLDVVKGFQNRNRPFIPLFPQK